MNRFSLVRRACAPVVVRGTLLLLFAATLHAKDSSEAAPHALEPAALAKLEFFPSPLDAEFNAPAPNSAPRALLLAPRDDPALIALEEEHSALRYERNLAELENRHGTLSPELYEPLSSLALLRQRRGEHQAALQLLERAAHIDKANHGLYSSEQITLARQILASRKALGDREGVRDQLERLVVLNQRHYGREHVETALALRELGEWQVEDFLQQLKYDAGASTQPALNASDPTDQYERQSTSLEPLYAAQRTLIDGIDMMVAQQDFANPGLFELENALIETYYLNGKRDLILRNPDYAHRMPPREIGSLTRFKHLSTPPDDYRHGVTAYQRQLAYLQRNPKATVGQLSRITLALADWHQLFDQFDAAAQQREQLRSWLGKSGLDDGQIDGLMLRDSPVLLPTFVHGPLSPREFAPQSMRGHVDLMIHVDPRGMVSDVETLGLSDDTPGEVVEKLVSLVKASRFRSDGEDGSTSGIRYYYQY